MTQPREYDWSACNQSAEMTVTRNGLVWLRGWAYCRQPKHEGDNHVYEFSATYTEPYLSPSIPERQPK